MERPPISRGRIIACLPWDRQFTSCPAQPDVPVALIGLINFAKQSADVARRVAILRCGQGKECL